MSALASAVQPHTPETVNELKRGFMKESSADNRRIAEDSTLFMVQNTSHAYPERSASKSSPVKGLIPWHLLPEP